MARMLRAKSREARMKNPGYGPEESGAYGDLLGQQYYDMVGSRRPPDGPRTLMFAVLEDGIRCYLSTMHARRPSQRRRFEEAKAWIENRADIGPFAFETLCTTFDIDPGALRKQVLSMTSLKLPRRLTGISRPSAPRAIRKRKRARRR
jgi:hypothetical protein